MLVAEFTTKEAFFAALPKPADTFGAIVYGCGCGYVVGFAVNKCQHEKLLSAMRASTPEDLEPIRQSIETEIGYWAVNAIALFIMQHWTHVGPVGFAMYQQEAVANEAK